MKLFNKIAAAISLALVVAACALPPWAPIERTTVSPAKESATQVATADADVKGAGLLARLPMKFVENRGQWQTPAKFVTRKGALTAAFAQDAITLRYGEREALRLAFEGASEHPEMIGEGKLAGHFNYIRGSDARDWRLQVPSYESVLYRSLYGGVDLRVRDESGKLEYDVLLKPNADLAQIVLRVEGASKLELGDEGALLVHTKSGVLRQTAPRTWEVLPGGQKRMIAARFHILDAQRYGFEVPQRDQKLALVIDPGLDWSTFLGGGLEDFVNGVDIARDGSGDILVTGVTSSADFPQATFGSSSLKVYVARLSASGDALRYVTFLSGNAATGTYVGRLAADASGGVAVVGYTGDTTFPVTAGAFQTAMRGARDVFIARLNSVGALTAATFLGGSGDEAAAFTSRGIAFDLTGSVIVAGVTLSSDFPTTVGAYDRTYNPTNAFTTDTFIARLSPSLNQLTYSTFFAAGAWVKDLVVDPLGYVTLAGETGDTLPTTAGALDAVFNNGVAGVGGEDGFVARLKLDGAGAADLKYSTYLGGHNRDEAWGLAFDPNNPELVTVVGWTWQNAFARDFPTTPGSYRPNPLPHSATTTSDPYVQEGFVTRFRFPAAGGGALVWSSFIGGSLWEHATDVAIDSSGGAIVLGGTRSFDFPTTRGAYDRTLGGIAGAPYDCFVSRISSDGSQLLYSTLLGGTGANPQAGSLGNECEQPANNNESHIVYAGGNSVLVVGETKSPDFPATPGAFDPSFAPGPAGFAATRDTFITKLTVTPDASGDLTVAAPTLISPANGAATPNTTNVTLAWNSVADTSGIEAYNYQMSSRPDFPDAYVHYRGSVATNSLSLTSVAQVTWYWRIQAADRAGNLSEWSSPFSFNSGSAAPPATAPTLLNPASGASVGQPVNFDWSDVSGATSYEIQIDNSSTIASPFVASQTLTASHTSIAGLPAQSLWWRVRAINSGGAGPFSSMRSFTPQSGVTLPAPALVSPANDARFSPGRAITFDWSDVSGATSYSIEIDDSSTIAAPLILTQTVTSSQTTIGSLPTRRMWWRVRANGSAGAAGTWSEVRRFEVK